MKEESLGERAARMPQPDPYHGPVLPPELARREFLEWLAAIDAYHVEAGARIRERLRMRQ